MIGCVRAGVLLERRASGLDEADRLVLEEHLQTCPRCREEANVLDAIRQTMASTSPASPARLQRAVHSAINRGLRPESPQAGSRVSARLALAAALAAVICVLVLVAWPKPQPRAPAQASVDFSALRAHRVVEGSLRIGDQQVGIDGPVPDNRQMSAPELVRLALEDASVEIDRGSVVSWHSGQTSLALVEGAVRVDLPPRADRTFRVTTPSFVVEVVGTRFQVTPRSVTVERGKVRVTVPGQSSVLVSAGERWSIPESSAKPAEEITETSSRPSGPSVAALLARARQAIARGEVVAARRDIAAALRSTPTTQQVAEADTLSAECALVAGDSEGAARRYQEVAKQHAGSAAGENALFAAARLAATKGKRAEAVKLFRRYLTQYPDGQFNSEARARLEALASAE